MIQDWGDLRVSQTHKIDLLYGCVDCFRQILYLSDGKDEQIIAGLLESAVGEINSLVQCLVCRTSSEFDPVPRFLWIFNDVLSTLMFFGILIISSKSILLNFILCMTGALIIGLGTFLLVDYDIPYLGLITIPRAF